MADKFMAANPGVKVSVTPVDWGQAVAKLQTAIGGGETPDVSQMGTDMMGQFVETGALETVPADYRPGAILRERLEDQRRRRPGLRRAVVRRDAASSTTARTSPRRPGSRPPPATWDELKAMAKAMQAKGGAEYGIALGTKNCQEYLPFVWSNGGDVSARTASSRSKPRRPSRP